MHPRVLAVLAYRAHCWLMINLPQNSQISFHRTALKTLVPHSAHISRLVLSQAQNLALAFSKFHVTGDCTALQFIKISLQRPLYPQESQQFSPSSVSANLLTVLYPSHWWKDWRELDLKCSPLESQLWPATNPGVTSYIFRPNQSASCSPMIICFCLTTCWTFCLEECCEKQCRILSWNLKYYISVLLWSTFWATLL